MKLTRYRHMLWACVALTSAPGCHIGKWVERMLGYQMIAQWQCCTMLYLENIGKYFFLGNSAPVLGVKLMEINSNLLSRNFGFLRSYTETVYYYFSVCGCCWCWCCWCWLSLLRCTLPLSSKNMLTMLTSCSFLVLNDLTLRILDPPMEGFEPI